MTTTTQDAATPPPMIVGRRGRALVALLALAGLLLMLYPSAAMWFSDREQYAAMIEQQRQVEELGPFGRAEALASANRYNQLLDERSLVDPYTGQLPDLTSLDYQAYLSELDLAADPTMGRLLVPSIDVDLPIYHGTTDATLRRGVGHLFGSALPVGGIGNHPILTAHAGLPESMLFTRLEDLVIGDEFEIVVYNEHLRYRVTSIEVILPNRSDKLLPVAGKDLVSLLTCTPIGINTHRLLVTAERIPSSVDSYVEQPPTPPGFPWWAVLASSALASSIIAIAWHTRPASL